MAKKRRDRKRAKNTNDTFGRRNNYKDLVRENSDFETYYKCLCRVVVEDGKNAATQKICGEEYWDEFLATLRSNLPTGFRITSYPKTEAKAMLSLIENTFFKNLFDSGDEGVHKAHCLPWYPDRLGWQMSLTRNDIRKSEEYFRLHNFLISETESGNISRQEVVSMIPPLLLDIKSHHKVLDMCAAPGSKTAQLIEQLHTQTDSSLPSGIVVANDIDNKRCYMLVHQAKRLNSPCAIITNHDAAIMPNILVKNDEGETSIMKFDRVLCDVPCTGDGTMRKNPDIWIKWNSVNANNLHGVQIRILKRGLEMLEIGGRLVYSTCSLNPVENEAIIHRIQVEAQGSLKVVDVSSKLVGLKYQPGITHWLPASKDMHFYEKYEDVPEKHETVVRPTMFSPSASDASKFGLDKCIRILPHFQDTGGFFVTVLEKVASLPWEAQVDDSESSQKLKIGRRPTKRIRIGHKEDPFVFFNEDELVWASIRDFYGMKSNEVLPSCLFTRCEVGKKKNIYFSSPLVKNILITNADRIKIINSGVKVFARCDNKSMACAFRLVHEGLLSIEPFIGNDRTISLKRCDFVKIMLHTNSKNPLSMDELESDVKSRLMEIGMILTKVELPKTGNQFRTSDVAGAIKVYFSRMGSCVIKLDDDEIPLSVVGWRGNMSVRCYLTLSDSIHYLRILGEDVTKFEVNKFKKPVVSTESIEEFDTEKKTETNSNDGGELNITGNAEDIRSKRKMTRISDLCVDLVATENEK